MQFYAEVDFLKDAQKTVLNGFLFYLCSVSERKELTAGARCGSMHICDERLAMMLAQFTSMVLPNG